VPTPWRSVGEVLIFLSYVHRRINFCRLVWRMASVTPDPWLAFRLWGITALWPVPNYTAYISEAHVCEQLAYGCHLEVERLRVALPWGREFTSPM